MSETHGMWRQSDANTFTSYPPSLLRAEWAMKDSNDLHKGVYLWVTTWGDTVTMKLKWIIYVHQCQKPNNKNFLFLCWRFGVYFLQVFTCGNHSWLHHMSWQFSIIPPNLLMQKVMIAIKSKLEYKSWIQQDSRLLLVSLKKKWNPISPSLACLHYRILENCLLSHLAFPPDRHSTQSEQRMRASLLSLSSFKAFENNPWSRTFSKLL